MNKNIEQELKNLETSIPIYSNAVSDKSISEKDRRLISFKLLYEMISFSTLKEFITDYVPSSNIELILAEGLRNTKDLVEIQDGKIKISSEYDNLLKQREEFLKNNNNDKVD